MPELLDILTLAPPFTFGGTPAPDTNAPAIGGVSVGSLTTSGGTVSWTTDEAADSQVEYGLTSGYGSTSTLNTSLVTSHGVALTGLAGGTAYHFRVKSRDAAGNLATSGDFAFTTVTVGAAEGYFVQRAIVLRTAGQANFDVQFNLDPNALVADETTVQAIIDDTDNWVRGRCYFYGLPKADPVNYVAAGDELLGYLHEPASRRARARGYLIRGEVGGSGGGANGAEGQMTAMRDQAEAEINDLIQAGVRRAADAAGTAGVNDGITVIQSACVCSTYVRPPYPV